LRPTVNDIAREADVSLATVDRVLNMRPGVREKTIRAVHDAIDRLGYVRDVAAANLARGRNYRMAFVLPDTQGQFVQTIVAALDMAAQQAAAARTEIILCRFPEEDPHALAATLIGLVERDIAGVAIMAPETPMVRDAIRYLRSSGLAVVAFVSDLPNTESEHFIGIDNRAAGRTAGVLMGRFLKSGPAKVMVLAQSMLLRDSIERRLGFDEVMQRDFPGVEVLPTLESHGSPAIIREVVGESLKHAPDAAGVYLLGSGHRAMTQELAASGLTKRVVVIGHELTPHAANSLLSGTMDAVIAQNVGHLVRSALRILRAKSDRASIDEGQERIRTEIVIRENLSSHLALQDDSAGHDKTKEAT
jgi:LacI family transcriptional regulator